MDMSLTDEERNRRSAFHKKVEEMKAGLKVVMDCPQCLLIFSDVIMFRMHMSMHGSSPNATWQCSICNRQCSDRMEFLEHTVQYSHSLVPPGVQLPAGFSNFQCGLPDLTKLCAPGVLEQFDEVFQKK